MTNLSVKPKIYISQTHCYRCLTAGRHTPVPLTSDTYRCPVCGFAARIERVSLADLWWDRPDLRLGRVRWAAGEAHCLELVSPGPEGP